MVVNGVDGDVGLLKRFQARNNTHYKSNKPKIGNLSGKFNQKFYPHFHSLWNFTMWSFAHLETVLFFSPSSPFFCVNRWSSARLEHQFSSLSTDFHSGFRSWLWLDHSNTWIFFHLAPETKRKCFWLWMQKRNGHFRRFSVSRGGQIDPKYRRYQCLYRYRIQ